MIIDPSHSPHSTTNFNCRSPSLYLTYLGDQINLLRWHNHHPPPVPTDAHHRIQKRGTL